MPRFVARPVVVEAHQNLSGAALPSSFSVAIRRHLPNGAVEVGTADGARPCFNRDWIIRGADGAFSVMRDAAFEALFVEQAPRTTLRLPARLKE